MNVVLLVMEAGDCFEEHASSGPISHPDRKHSLPSEKVALILLKDHVEHCVREAIEEGEKADEKVAELGATQKTVRL